MVINHLLHGMILQVPFPFSIWVAPGPEDTVGCIVEFLPPKRNPTFNAGSSRIFGGWQTEFRWAFFGGGETRWVFQGRIYNGGGCFGAKTSVGKSAVKSLRGGRAMFLFVLGDSKKNECIWPV